MSYFEPKLQPVIIINITPNVEVIIEPPQDKETRALLRSQNMHVLPRTIRLKTGEWHLFLNGYFNEPYSHNGAEFRLTRNFDVNEFLISKGLPNLATLQKMIVKSAPGFKNA